MRLSKAIQGFEIAFLADGKSAETLRSYRFTLRGLARFLNDPDVTEVTAMDLQRFMVYLQTEHRPKRQNGDTAPLSNSSLAKAWAVIRSFWNWAAQEFDIKDRPDAKLKKPKVTPKVIIPFSEDEVRRLLKAAETTKEAKTNGRKSYTFKRRTAERDTALILTLLDTGLRVSELARLKVGDVDLESGQVIVKSWGSGTKSKSRTVYLGKAARRGAWRYIAGKDEPRSTDPLFLTDDGRPMNRGSIRLALVRLGKIAGVRAHPHRFRHTFATQFLKNGGDVFTLRVLLGHSDLSTVMIYVQLAQLDPAEIHRRTSPANGWHL